MKLLILIFKSRALAYLSILFKTRKMRTSIILIIALIATVSWGLTINPEHFKKDAKFQSIFNDFWVNTSDDEHAMAERILSGDPSLLAALQSGKINRKQDQKLVKLFTEDDEFRAIQIAQMSAGVPQFAFIAELDREKQISLIAKLMKSMSDGDMNAFVKIIISNKQFRAAFISDLESAGLTGFSKLSKQQQNDFFRFAFGAPEDKNKYKQKVMNDPELLAFFRALGEKSDAVEAGSHLLIKRVKHQMQKLHLNPGL